MELTKKILNISIAISIVLLSFSVFIYSIRDNKAVAMPDMDKDGYVIAGTGVTQQYVQYFSKGKYRLLPSVKDSLSA